MILIIGGAYQGKLDFAKEAFGVPDVTCEKSPIQENYGTVYRKSDFGQFQSRIFSYVSITWVFYIYGKMVVVHTGLLSWFMVWL